MVLVTGRAGRETTSDSRANFFHGPRCPTAGHHRPGAEPEAQNREAMLGTQEALTGWQSLSSPGSGFVSLCSFPRVSGFQIPQRIPWQHAAPAVLHGNMPAPTSHALGVVIRSQPCRVCARPRRDSGLPKPELLLLEDVSLLRNRTHSPKGIPTTLSGSPSG